MHNTVFCMQVTRVMLFNFISGGISNVQSYEKSVCSAHALEQGYQLLRNGILQLDTILVSSARH